MSRHQTLLEIKKQMQASLNQRSGQPLPWKQNTRKALKARDLRREEWPDFDQRRQNVTQRRREAIDHLDHLHEKLRQKWKENGIIPHYVENEQEACEAIETIVRKKGTDRLLKSKTMLSEEIGLNHFLEDRGIRPVETDLGEYIVQLRGETPSHITMPAMHMNRREVGELFAEHLDVPFTDDPPTLTRLAREALRKEFLEAKVGLCGVNFAVADTGHLATVTNEGNGRMVTSLPKTVIALMGWERVTQSLEDLGELWQLLSRSATGQRSTVYLNLQQKPVAGPVGPDEIHVIVVDNGRRRIHRDASSRDILRCIRCGACLNVCPVYQQVGGHPYGGTYQGPIGIVLTPLLKGADEAPHHAFASSLCGACEEICPVSIPLPKMMLQLRHKRTDTRSSANPENLMWKGFRHVMKSHRTYEAGSRLARTAQKLWPGKALPIPGWTTHRDAPAFAKRSFREWFEKTEGSEGETGDNNS